MLDDMSTTSSAPTATARPTGWTVPRSVAWFRYALLALCATVGIGMLAFGTRPADFNELGRAINAGRVTQVVIANALPENATGTASAEIRWHDGFLPRFTTVWQEIPGDEPAGQVVINTTSPSYPITGRIEDRLQEYAGQPLDVTHIQDYRNTTWWLYGWKVPAWVGIGGLLGALLTLGLLVSGPQTLRATRWAWFWAISSPLSPVTIPLFLLFGVPRTGAIEQPYTKAGRLTGGWSFLLFCVLGASIVQNLL